MENNKFRRIGNTYHNGIKFWNMNELPKDPEWLKTFQVDIEWWNGHDFQNIIAFKSHEDWVMFLNAIENLVKFYHVMEKINEDFIIFFKSFNKDSLNELKEDCPKFIQTFYWEDIKAAADDGFVLIYFTTQRECHDKNQFLTYMLDNWMYCRLDTGHRWLPEDEITNIKNINFICLNQK